MFPFVATGLKFGKTLDRTTFSCPAKDNAAQFSLAFPRPLNNAGTNNNTDTDADGLIDQLDCRDSGAGANTFLWPVVEALNLRVAGASPSTISWSDQTEMHGSGLRYDLERGTLPFVNGFTDDACFQTDIIPNSASDTTTPTLGQVGFYYLVRGGQNAVAPCVPAGTYGAGSTGTPSRDANLTACP